MQIVLLPVGLCNKIEKLILNFLWGGGYKERTCSLVLWETVLKPKEVGGLGIKCLTSMNLAFMAKLGWRMLNERNTPWVRVLEAKYIHHDINLHSFQSKHMSSNVWKGISRVATTLVKGTQLLVGNGKNISFWLDSWLINEPLCIYLLKDIDIVDKHRMVCEHWRSDEGWNWNYLDDLLPNDIKDKLAAVILRDDVENVDGYYWNKSTNGMFSIKSAYQLVEGVIEYVESNCWK
ncbi:hypothetical protein PTKIN_Ptkin13bG0180300 [Pterospermum kingtungense]